MCCLFFPDRAENGAYQKVMKQVLVPIVERYQCIDELRSTRLGDRFCLHPTYFCAGGKEGQDSCTVSNSISTSEDFEIPARLLVLDTLIPLISKGHC